MTVLIAGPELRRRAIEQTIAESVQKGSVGHAASERLRILRTIHERPELAEGFQRAAFQAYRRAEPQ